LRSCTVTRRALGVSWRAQDAVVETPAQVVSGSPADYHEFTLPQYAGDGSVIALYSDLAHTPRLVRVRDGKTEVLHAGIGLFGDRQFHVRGRTAVWSEYAVSPRWGEENYLVVKTLDLETRRVRRLTERSRYFAPALSPDGARIAAVHFSHEREATSWCCRHRGAAARPEPCGALSRDAGVGAERDGAVCRRGRSVARKRTGAPVARWRGARHADRVHP
jgi:hypothetical protein